MRNLCNPNAMSSAKVIAENEDLVTQILLRLPVKSLVRFKCVSKEWFALISSSYFSLSHTRRHPTPQTSSLLMIKSQSLILLSVGHEKNSRIGFRIPSLDFFNTTADIRMKIVEVCNGLTLCYLASSVNDFNFVYCICNLTTRKFITLPRPGMIINKPVIGINLAFDPSKSPHFKVICVGQSYMLRDRICQIEIYSSETRVWRRWNGSFLNPYHMLEVLDRGVFCNGAIHWLCTRGDSYYFVLEDESLRILPMPMHVRINYTTKRLRYLGQSRGHLHLIDIEANTYYYNSPMEIFEMERDYSGWILKYRIDFNDMGSVFPEMIRHVEVHTQYFENYTIHYSRCYLSSVLSVIRGEDEESMEIVLSIPHRIISYNPKYNSIKVLLYFADAEVQDHKWYDVFQFTETLSRL